MATDDKRLFSKARVELSVDHLKLAKDLKVGGKVRIVLYGVLTELSQAKVDETEDSADRGSLAMDVSNMRLASNNEIADLFDDEFDG